MSHTPDAFSPMARATTAQPTKRPEQNFEEHKEQYMKISGESEKHTQSTNRKNVGKTAQPLLEQSLERKAKKAAFTAAGLINVEDVHLSLEQIEIIQKLFEVFDFVKRQGESNLTVPKQAQNSKAPKGNAANVHDANSAWETPNSCFSQVCLLDENDRKEKKNKAIYQMSRQASIARAASVTSSYSAIEAEEQNTVHSLSAQLEGLPTFAACVPYIKFCVEKMEKWRTYEKLLKREKKRELAEQGKLNVAEMLKGVKRDNDDFGNSADDKDSVIVTSIVGVPFAYFANYVAGPFYDAFFTTVSHAPSRSLSLENSRRAGGVTFVSTEDTPRDRRPNNVAASESGKKKARTEARGNENDEDTDTSSSASATPPPPMTLDTIPESSYDPQNTEQVGKLYRLFQAMDSNADGYVSWDDFSQFVIQAGERFFLNNGDNDEMLQRQKNPARLSYPLQFLPLPTNKNTWQSMYPLVYHLYHTTPFHKFICSDRSRNYFTGSLDGLVKLWRPDSQLADRKGQPSIVHERNLLSVPSPITDMYLSPASLGDSEVVAVSAMDGTISFIRVATGEVIRTMLGVRSSNEEQVRALSEVYSKRPGGVRRQKQEFEADDLLSLRQRPTAASGTVIRQPYTIPAYREEALEIFFGKVSRYFKSVEVMAPTYSHLKSPHAVASDVLFEFGAPHLTQEAYGNQTDKNQGSENSWFASAVALAHVPPSFSSFQILKGGAYLFLGFETGVLMAYELNGDWFRVSHLNATRVEPPVGRHPVFSAVLHEAAINAIIVSEVNELIMTVSDDGTVGIRSFGRIDVPMMTLGTSCVDRFRPFSYDRSAEDEDAPKSRPEKNNSSHVARIVCSCWSEEFNVLATGGMDYMVFLWTPRASIKPYRHIDLRELQRTNEDLMQLGTCGFPVDISFMDRSGDPLRLIILDSRRVIRLLNAFTSEVVGVLSDDSLSSVGLGDMLICRYEPHEDRLLLGGNCLRVWEMKETDEHARDYFGHRKSVLFLCWHPRLNVYITADEDHVVLWKSQLCVNDLAVTRRDKRREMRIKIREAAELKAIKDQEALRLGGGPTVSFAVDVGKPGSSEDEREYSRDTSFSSKATLEAESGETFFLSPTLCEDPNFFNHTYWKFNSSIAKSFNVEEGIRGISTNPASMNITVFVALLRERAIVQYNGFNGTRLKKFTFPEEVQDIFDITNGEALLSKATLLPTPILCAAYEQYPQKGVTAIYHVMQNDAEMGGTLSGSSKFAKKKNTTNTFGANGGNSSSGGSDQKKGEVDQVAVVEPHRLLLNDKTPVSSVIILKNFSLIVYGGMNRLFVTSTKESTSFAVPLKLLAESDFYASQNTTSIVRPMHLAALFPGRLVTNPMHLLLESNNMNSNSTKRRSRASTTTVMFPDENSQYNVSAVEAISLPDCDAVPQMDKRNKNETYYLDAQQSTCGHIGHILHLPDTPYLFSGNNVGLLQLWSLETMSEIFRIKATLGNDTITSLSFSLPPGSETAQTEGGQPLYLAVGDQWGYVVILDISHVPFFDEEIPLQEVNNFEQNIIVVDRWRAHRQDVRGIQFMSSMSLAHNCSEEDEQRAENRYTDLHRTARRSVSLQKLMNSFGANTPPRLDVFDESADSGSDEGEEFGVPRHSSTAFGKTPARLDMEDQVRHSLYLADPITVVTAGEDDAVLVWRWHQGTLQCMGSFGAGNKTKISPPLSNPAFQCMHVFETARRLYVLKRLVDELNFFYISRTTANDPNFALRFMNEEIQNCLSFMEWDLQSLVQEDPVNILGTWGSMSWRALPSAGSFTNWQHQRSMGSQRYSGAGNGRWNGETFDVGGLLGSFDWLGETTVAPEVPDYLAHRTPYTLANVAEKVKEEEERDRQIADDRVNNNNNNENSNGEFRSVAGDAEFDSVFGQDENSVNFSVYAAASVSAGGDSNGTWRTNAATIGRGNNNFARNRFKESITPANAKKYTQRSGSQKQDNILPRSQWKLSPHSVYVFAFVCGVYLDNNVEDCIRRTLNAVKTDIVKFRQNPRRKVSKLQTKAVPPAASTNIVMFDDAGGEDEDIAFSELNGTPRTQDHSDLQNSTSQDYPSAFGRRGTNADASRSLPSKNLNALSGTLKQGDAHTKFGSGSTSTAITTSTENKAPGSERRSSSAPPAPLLSSLRSEVRNPTEYKVSYGKSNNLVHNVNAAGGKNAGANGNPNTRDTTETASYLPSIVARTHRKQLERDMAQRKRQSLANHRVEAEDEDVTDAEPHLSTAQVIQEAYLQRRQEEAIKKLTQLQQEEIKNHLLEGNNGPTRDRKNLLLQAGIVHGLANYDDFFATTGTKNLLFGEEKQILKQQQVGKKAHRVSAAFIQKSKNSVFSEDSALNRSGTDDADDDPNLDWHTKRERNLRKARKEEVLWAPSNVMVTLMDWEAPRPTGNGEGGTKDGANAKGASPANKNIGWKKEEEQKLPIKRNFVLPSMLPFALPERRSNSPIPDTEGTLNEGLPPTSESVDLSAAPSNNSGKTASSKSNFKHKLLSGADEIPDGEKKASPSELAEEVDQMKQKMRDAVQEREALVSSYIRQEQEAVNESSDPNQANLGSTLNSRGQAYGRSQMLFQRKPRYTK